MVQGMSSSSLRWQAEKGLADPPRDGGPHPCGDEAEPWVFLSALLILATQNALEVQASFKRLLLFHLHDKPMRQEQDLHSL